MPTILCMLPGCTEEHEVKNDKNGRPYISCPLWRQTIFFNSGMPMAYLDRQLEEVEFE